MKDIDLWLHTVWQKLTKTLDKSAVATFTDEELPRESEVKDFSETSIHF